jgi:hypothetical protein
VSADHQLPQRVLDFVERQIHSVAELEALLLIRSEPQERWDAPAVARRLYIDEASTAAVLDALQRRGLVVRDGDAFRYEPASPSLREDVDGLARSYPRFLIPITKVIHSKPPTSLREFLDAFRFRDDKQRG